MAIVVSPCYNGGMTNDKPPSPFFSEYELPKHRAETPREPASHQHQALESLRKWYSTKNSPHGGILVLPTGGGKTFTAAHFICREVLSEGGNKVLWLAHTCHLLEQAYGSLRGCVGLIREPAMSLHTRLVSGQGGDHFPLHTVQPDDDVLFCTLPTACRAMKDQHPALLNFLDGCVGKLFIVVDEAHHAPAPSYRELLRKLRERYPQISILGLTATPTHNDANKVNWLRELFTQGIIYQVTANELMMQGILARPVTHHMQTFFKPDFNDREYRMWLNTHSDIPENVVTELANNKTRNDTIIATYVNQRDKWGKTIIFADRWYQCDYLREGLNARGVRADVVYNYVAGRMGTPESRNRHTSDDNHRNLHAFRNGELDVLINVQMLTEGTDVPNVETVFLTRQTTSRIILTQMIGRALRGPKFGGTEEAQIVCFIDDWQKHIDFAAFDHLATGPLDECIKVYRKNPPLHLISIDLLRRLARQMDSGTTINTEPYLSFLPTGWYIANYKARIAESQDDEDVKHQILVHAKSAPDFERFIEFVQSQFLEPWAEYELDKTALQPTLEEWHSQFFPAEQEHISSDMLRDLYAIVRHIAQSDNRAPSFIPYDAYKKHNLDELAREWMDADFSTREIKERIHREYESPGKHWKFYYATEWQFKSAYDACVNRIQYHAELRPAIVAEVKHPESTPDREPLEDVKKAIKARDGKRCLCCGRTNPLVIDHVLAFRYGGNNDPDNLQTLCKFCNRAKDDVKMDFREQKSIVKEPPSEFPEIGFPTDFARDPEEWERHLYMTINQFYRASVVASVEIGQRGERFHHWVVQLHFGNNPSWPDRYIDYYARRVRQERSAAGLTPAPQTITFTVQDPQ
ncbi:MAG: DEAD/DEAH box helicase family protein [Gemmataceae bacterium]